LSWLALSAEPSLALANGGGFCRDDCGTAGPVLLGGAAIVALVGLSFHLWGLSSGTNQPTERISYRLVAAVCGALIVAVSYFFPYAIVAAALTGTAIGIIWATVGNLSR